MSFSLETALWFWFWLGCWGTLFGSYLRHESINSLNLLWSFTSDTFSSEYFKFLMLNLFSNILLSFLSISFLTLLISKCRLLFEFSNILITYSLSPSPLLNLFSLLMLSYCTFLKKLADWFRFEFNDLNTFKLFWFVILLELP